MVSNRFLLGSVAFGVSFGIGLITLRDLGRAFLTGLTTLPAAYAATAIVNRRYALQADNRIAVLTSHISALQQRRMEAYQAFTEMMAEKDRVAAALNSMQLQLRQLQLSGSPAPLPAGRPAVSWNLAAAPTPPSLPPQAQPYDLPTEIQPPAQRDPQFDRVLSEAAMTKRKIETSLHSLQSELAVLKDQTIGQRQIRDRLAQELASLSAEKQQLETDAIALRQEVQDLDYCRQELERFIEYAELKKQELDAGTHPLQVALKQLQTEINHLHEELRLLESQVLERRAQKEDLDQQLAELKAQPLPPQAPDAALDRPSTKPESNNGNKRSQPSSKAERSRKETSKPVAQAESPQPQQPKVNSITSVSLPNLPKPDPLPTAIPAPELPNEWTELMLQLPEYEIQVLKAIVEQSNPAPSVKRIAEANLTMPELLLDSINERALDTVGDLILESTPGTGSATIAAEHWTLVNQLIQTYESLI